VRCDGFAFNGEIEQDASASFIGECSRQPPATCSVIQQVGLIHVVDPRFLQGPLERRNDPIQFKIRGADQQTADSTRVAWSLYVLRMAAANASARGQWAAILASPLTELSGFCLVVDCLTAGCGGERTSLCPIWRASTAPAGRSVTCYAACAVQAAVAGAQGPRGW
jgi:hypothetical protein